MELDQVDVVDAEPGERSVQARSGTVCGSLVGLRGEEEVIPAGCQPGCEPQFGVSVTGRGIQMVDAEVVQEGKEAISCRLADARGAADPKMTRELACPVRPKGRRSITQSW